MLMLAKEKLSLTLDHDLVEAARKRVGRRGFSAYLNEALAYRLQREGIEEYLAHQEREKGPIPPEVQAAVEKAFEKRHTRSRSRSRKHA
jgi:hypothetical protein